MGVRRGLEEHRLYEEERKKNMPPKRWLELFLQDDGDSAVMRILSPTIIDADFHRIFDGQKKKLFYCPAGDGLACEYCEANEKTSPLFCLWIWCYYKLHRHQPPQGVNWEKVQRGGIWYYKEPIDRLMYLRRGFGKDNVLYEQFSDSLVNYGSLNDRDYVFTRKGTDLKTTYNLTPLDKAAIDPEIAQKMNELPEISDAIKNNFALETEEAETDSDDLPPAPAPKETKKAAPVEEKKKEKAAPPPVGKKAKEVVADPDEPEDEAPF